MDVGKNDFSDVGDDALSKVDRKPPPHPSEETSVLGRKTVRRSKSFKLDDWYEKAALAMAISVKA